MAELLSQEEIDAMLAKGGEDMPASSKESPKASGTAMSSQSAQEGLNLLMDVPIEIIVEFGAKKMLLRNIMTLGDGRIVELDKMVDEPVDIYVNQTLVARGEIVAIDDYYAVRITEIADIQQRLQGIRRT